VSLKNKLKQSKETEKKKEKKRKDFLSRFALPPA
jgi:hypothetical protein